MASGNDLMGVNKERESRTNQSFFAFEVTIFPSILSKTIWFPKCIPKFLAELFVFYWGGDEKSEHFLYNYIQFHKLL